MSDTDLRKVRISHWKSEPVQEEDKQDMYLESPLVAYHIFMSSTFGLVLIFGDYIWFEKPPVIIPAFKPKKKNL